MTFALSAGIATSIGSLPHTDADEAAALVLARHPELPAAPQLPNRTRREGMIAQAAHGIPGVDVLDDGTLRADPDRVQSAIADGAPVDGSIRPEEAAGLLAFLEQAQGRTALIKVQLTGPVTLGLALARAGVPCRVAFTLAGEAVRARSRAMLDEAARRAPGSGVVAFLDEPSLSVIEHPGFPLAPYAVVDLLASALSGFRGAVATGVHCCGPSDWRAVIDAGPDILSFPVALAGSVHTAALGSFLERGGWIAWGAVPTDAPVSDDAGFLWRRLVAVWCDMVRAGCPSALLRERALVTPACGLAGHGPTQADRVLSLTAELGNRAREQASGRRLTIGA